MRIQESRWEIDLIKQRYLQLELSDEQARRIMRFEKENESLSGKNDFTDFEESDYFSWFFGTILRPEQYALFAKDRESQLQQVIEEIKKADTYHEYNVAWTERRFKYYKNELLPAIFSVPIMAGLFDIGNDWIKVEFLRRSYQIFLSERKKKVLISHFRYNRMYNPGRLELRLRQLDLDHLWPDYPGFLGYTDAPTIAVCEFLEKKAGLILRRPVQPYNDAVKKLEAFYIEEIELKKKIITDGWHTTIPDKRTETEKINQLGMQVLLCDRTAYGLLPEQDFDGDITEA